MTCARHRGHEAGPAVPSRISRLLPCHHLPGFDLGTCAGEPAFATLSPHPCSVRTDTLDVITGLVPVISMNWSAAPFRSGWPGLIPGSSPGTAMTAVGWMPRVRVPCCVQCQRASTFRPGAVRLRAGRMIEGGARGSRLDVDGKWRAGRRLARGIFRRTWTSAGLPRASGSAGCGTGGQARSPPHSCDASRARPSAGGDEQ
jgi:hypothetical protein